MGMYTGIRFKGVVKERFRKGFDVIAIDGNWGDFDDEYFEEFSKIGRSCFIPKGSLSYMPDEWEQNVLDENGNVILEPWDYPKKKDVDEFERSYDEQTGKWIFQCSLKNYESEIEQFFELVPYFIESIEYLEYFYEEWEYSKKYELIDGKVIRTSDKFIKYGDDELLLGC